MLPSTLYPFRVLDYLFHNSLVLYVYRRYFELVQTIFAVVFIRLFSDSLLLLQSADVVRSVLNIRLLHRSLNANLEDQPSLEVSPYRDPS